MKVDKANYQPRFEKKLIAKSMNLLYDDVGVIIGALRNAGEQNVEYFTNSQEHSFLFSSGKDSIDISKMDKFDFTEAAKGAIEIGKGKMNAIRDLRIPKYFKQRIIKKHLNRILNEIEN